jgi:MFS family permease
MYVLGFQGVGIGMCYVPAITMLTVYFKKRLTLASGIATAGGGVGVCLYPAVIRWLVTAYDWRDSLLILAAFFLNCLICGAVMRPLESPAVYVTRPRVPDKRARVVDLSPFRKSTFWVLCVNNFLVCFALSIMFLHIPAHARTVGVNDNEGAFLLSGMGVAEMVGRVLFGLIPWFSPVFLYMSAFTATGVVVLFLPLATTYPALMVASVLPCLLTGCYGTLMVPTLIHVLGVESFANGYGYIMVFMACGQLLGGPIAGKSAIGTNRN